MKPPVPLDVQALEKLIPELQSFIEDNRGSTIAAKAQVDLARAFFETGKYEEAVALSTKALDNLPGDPGLKALVRYQLALTYAAMGKTEEAAAAWNALREEGFSGITREAFWQLGMLHAKAGDFKRAIELYEEALKVEGTYPTSQLLQTEVLSLKAKAGITEVSKEPDTAHGKKLTD
jgi:predicted negative regulator of RcsB-dependent stress response